jgi:phosphatidate cytidylyltransferase
MNSSTTRLIIGLIALAVMLVVQYLTRNVKNSFITRCISGVILVLIALIVIIRGSWLLYATCLILSMIGAFEFYRALGLHEKGRADAMELAGYAGVLLYYLTLVFNWSHLEIGGLVAGLVLVMAVYVFTFPKYKVNQVMAAVFGILYVGVMLSFVYQTRMLPGGKYSVWLIFICSWGCDTSAYCFGRLFGKRKMAPVLSPHKTVAGGVGGVVGAAVLGLIYALCINQNCVHYFVISAVGAVISMIGDLSASAIKRNVNIKDYGKLIPGHGGVLDRFDSVIFTAPVIYFMASAVAV